jgi:hypothetical protein
MKYTCLLLCGRSLLTCTDHSYFLVIFRSSKITKITLHHPNILQLLSTYTEPPDLCLVMEYMPKGPLYKMLDDQYDSPPGYNDRWALPSSRASLAFSLPQDSAIGLAHRPVSTTADEKMTSTMWGCASPVAWTVHVQSRWASVRQVRPGLRGGLHGTLRAQCWRSATPS